MTDTHSPRFLCKGTGFKLHFNTNGNVTSFRDYQSQLEGQWVALVDATDNCHMRAPAESPDVAELRKQLDSAHRDWERYDSMLEACKKERDDLRAQLAKAEGERDQAVAEIGVWARKYGHATVAKPLSENATAVWPPFYPHTWDRDGERCTVCGDKDWMGGSCRPPAAEGGKGGDDLSHIDRNIADREANGATFPTESEVLDAFNRGKDHP